MSLLTLFIDDDHIEATIMVSLTNMLVMYTLYQNSIQQVPSTAYLKLLDYWLIFGTLVPCVTFVVLIVWEISKEKEEQSIYPNHTKMIPLERKSKGRRCKVWSQILLPFVLLTYIIGYIIVEGRTGT